MTESRGLRNNNPFNIRYTTRNKWLGKYYPPFKRDKEFEEFQDLKFGVRAAIIVLRNYIESGTDVVRDIICRWSPPSENNVINYVHYVCESSGFNSSDQVDSYDKIYRLLKSMAFYESRCNLEYTYIREVFRTYKLFFKFPKKPLFT